MCKHNDACAILDELFDDLECFEIILKNKINDLSGMCGYECEKTQEQHMAVARCSAYTASLIVLQDIMGKYKGADDEC